MDNSGIVAYREKLGQVVDKHRDFLGEEAERRCAEYSIPSAKNLQTALADIADEGRLLKIGIVGRVKSGKSSLLNALIFEGQSILPKAATPMTAALTTLSYGDTVSAEVEFFTREDIEDIAAKAGEYERHLKKHTDALLEEEKSKSRIRNPLESISTEKRERVQRRAARETSKAHRVLASCHEQHEKIKNSGISVGSLGESKLLNLSGDLSALQGQLEDYVGADGQYMPFTKSVNIRLPQVNLKDIEIVDTPGIDDPVQSREERTREHLHQCDVVLLVIPAGQFVNEEDWELMDRITSKEGIRELYVVAAQVDTQLFGSEKEKNDGQLDRVLNDIPGVLGGHLKKVIADLKESNPEVGDAYDQLLEGQSRVIHSAALCESMKQRFGARDGWDEGMEHVWGNLQAHYPDYFSATDESLSSINLGKLSNISAIRSIVEKVRENKEEIIEEKIGNYCRDISKSLHGLKAGLLAYANERQSEIESTDIEMVKEQREELGTSLSDASTDLELDYKDWVEEVIRELSGEAKNKIEELRRSLMDTINKEQGIKSKLVEVEKEGPIAWMQRVFGKLTIWGFVGSGYKSETKEYTTIRTNAISHGLSQVSLDMTALLKNLTQQKKKEGQANLIKIITKTLRENFDDEKFEASMIRRSVRVIVGSIPLPEFEYKSSLPDSLKPKGVLEERAAKKFSSDAENYLHSLCAELDERIAEYANDLAEEMRKAGSDLDERLLKQCEKEVVSLEKSIENKEVELKRINILKGELESIEVN